MNSHKKCRESFISYVDLDESNFNSSFDETFDDQLIARTLPGEMIIAKADNVLLFTPVTSHKKGKSGRLTVTNFKLSFVTSKEISSQASIYQENLLLDEYDVCLSNVDALYLTSNSKKRRLFPGNAVPPKIKYLFVVCKNMKLMTFSFKFSPPGHGNTLTNSLLLYAFPRRHELLFAFYYKEPPLKLDMELLLFRRREDWENELIRTGCEGWRLAVLNRNFHLTPTLPEHFVVMKDITDVQISVAAQHFRCSRPPLWCWSHKSGAALVRMADIMPTIQDSKQENAMLESVRKSHPKKTPPSVIDLNKDVPPKELYSSYCKLRDLCSPVSVRQFWVQDSHFYTLLENTKWLLYVSNCLQKAIEASRLLSKGVSVVFQESEGRDLCSVLSSLTVLLLDPHFRTLAGFQSLIQKEWVVLGHPFCTRLGYVCRNEEDIQQSPVFLLFLDCVWQLLQQHPTYFQFTETYLTTLWDAVHISIFDTFLFDCERDRSVAENDTNKPLILRSIWNWNQIFPEKDIRLFYNPFFRSEIQSDLTFPLDVQPYISDLQLWSQCYFRFVPLLEIAEGGNAQVDLMARSLVPEDHDSSVISLSTDTQVGSFFPFTQWGPSQTKISANSLLHSSNLNLNNSDAVYTRPEDSFTDF